MAAQIVSVLRIPTVVLKTRRTDVQRSWMSFNHQDIKNINYARQLKYTLLIDNVSNDTLFACTTTSQCMEHTKISLR